MTLKEWLTQNDAPLVNEAERYHKALRALIDAGYDPDTVVTDFIADCCAFQKTYDEVKNAVELGLDHGDAETSDYANHNVTPKQVLAMVKLMSTWSNTYAPQYVSNGVGRKPSWLVPVGNYEHTHKMYIGIEPDGSCHS